MKKTSRKTVQGLLESAAQHLAVAEKDLAAVDDSGLGDMNKKAKELRARHKEAQLALRQKQTQLLEIVSQLTIIANEGSIDIPIGDPVTTVSVNANMTFRTRHMGLKNATEFVLATRAKDVNELMGRLWEVVERNLNGALVKLKDNTAASKSIYEKMLAVSDRLETEPAEQVSPSAPPQQIASE